jgi:hypothetical protein
VGTHRLMALTSDEHRFEVGGSVVEVIGRTGPVHATWVLVLDGLEADSAKAAGDFTLRGDLPDGSQVRAQVHQSLLGPTEVVVQHQGEVVGRAKGFVA